MIKYPFDSTVGWGRTPTESPRWPDCRAVIPERDPLVDWWLCDNCALEVADGTRLALSAANHGTKRPSDLA